MLRKASVVLAGMLFVTSTAFIPADAATKISNGVACSKRNATTKVGGDTYRCTTNPTTTSKKLVWMWAGCLDANKAYLNSKAQYDGILKQIAGSSTKLTSTIQTSINRMITWKDTKIYAKNDVVYENAKTYYVSLVDDNSKKLPSANLGSAWAVYMPTAADANVGTSPDANTVIAMKEKDVVDWNKNIEVLNAEIKRLEGLKSPTTTDKANIARYKSAVTTFGIGIKNANTNIKNLKANISLLNSTNSNKAIVESVKSEVDQAKMIRTQSCARGI
jgi:hypothetical protein